MEAELVAAIAAVDDRFDIRYEPGRSPELYDAEIVLGFPGDSPRDLATMVTSNARLRWVQATVRGAGEHVRASRLTELELGQVQITRTGIHVGPLAEFAMFGILAFAKNLPRLLDGARTRSWEQVPMSELSDQTLLLIGLGSTGVEVARLGSAFGMCVVGVNRTGRGRILGVEAIRPPRFLADLLPTAHAVVVTLPLTEQTRGMIDATAISRMRADSVLVNVGAGGVIDEQALIDGLENGQPAGGVPRRFRDGAVAEGQPAVAPPQRGDQPGHRGACSARRQTGRLILHSEPAEVPVRG